MVTWKMQQRQQAHRKQPQVAADAILRAMTDELARLEGMQLSSQHIERLKQLRGRLNALVCSKSSQGRRRSFTLDDDRWQQMFC